jgi:hypothetical protein
MGKLSGVNANLITKVSGVPVANISKVGPILASSIGLGGGGGGGEKLFDGEGFGDGGTACIMGPLSISKGGSQTLYQSGETFYTNPGLTTPFDGGGNWWYNGTDNRSYQIGNEGNFFDTFSCG